MNARNDSFEERLKRAAEAKQAALDKLRARPAADPAVIAEQQARQQRRDMAEAEKRAAKAEAARIAAEAKLAAVEAEEAAPAPPTDAELKARRDARYAARKKRK